MAHQHIATCTHGNLQFTNLLQPIWLPVLRRCRDLHYNVIYMQISRWAWMTIRKKQLRCLFIIIVVIIPTVPIELFDFENVGWAFWI